AWLSGLSPKENREIPPLDYARVRRLKRDFPELTVILNGGLASAADCLAELEHVDGVMLGRAAYRDPWLVAELDAALFGPLPESAAPSTALAAYVEYAAHEAEAGTPLKSVTRHMLGLGAGRPGGRRFRRDLGEIGDGT